MTWSAAQYDRFQKNYQFQNGVELIAQLEKATSLPGKAMLDLGCGSGDLTILLKEKVGIAGCITAVDNDPGMLQIFHQKETSKHIKIHKSDLTSFLQSTTEQYQVVFSNAVFHWLDSYAQLVHVLELIRQRLMAPGYLAVRFSLIDNATAVKDFLEKYLRQFLEKESLTLWRSIFEFDRCALALKEADFEVITAIEKRFTPFKNSQQSFYWMLHSQPLLRYLPSQTLPEFEKYLHTQWLQTPVEFRSHHAIFVVRTYHA